MAGRNNCTPPFFQDRKRRNNQTTPAEERSAQHVEGTTRVTAEVEGRQKGDCIDMFDMETPTWWHCVHSKPGRMKLTLRETGWMGGWVDGWRLAGRRNTLMSRQGLCARKRPAAYEAVWSEVEKAVNETSSAVIITGWQVRLQMCAIFAANTITGVWP